jgi:hypothetical protein
MKKALIILCLIISANIFSQENRLFSNEGVIQFQNSDYLFIILLVDDLQEAINIWNIPNETPRINHITNIRINEPISLFILYATDRDRINLTYSLRLREPDGRLSWKNFQGLKISDTVINKRILYRALQLPEITFDENEKTGKYCFIVDIYDNDNFIVTLELEFDLFL